jgi:hypothetical protein
MKLKEVVIQVKRISLPAVFIPYVKGISEKFKQICNCYNIKTIFKTKKTLRSLLMGIRLETNLVQTPGCVYNIPCECGGNKETIGSADPRA